VWTSLGIDPLPFERAQMHKGFSNNNAAYQLYLIGRYQMTNRSSENLRKSIETFTRAVEKDQSFALGYVGLADAYALLNLYDIEPPKDAYPKAYENTAKALNIDYDLADAHASLAYIKFYHQRDRPGAELEFRRSIQMNPSYAQAHHWFALALAGMNRPVEALTEAQTAQRLDPQSAAIKSATAIVYFMSGRNDDALAECDKALALSEGFVPALKVKRWTYSEMNAREEANEAFQKELSYSGGKITDPGWQVVQMQIASPNTNREENLKRLADATNVEPVRGNDYTFAFEIAIAYNNLGEPEKALDWLERAESANSHSFSYINVEPRLANLRDVPRFQRLTRKFDQGGN
ncbi:MAG: tetratricopeptide repeat protein, partial [Candidatus Binatia bacterium]